jgi:hypothetical protein
LAALTLVLISRFILPESYLLTILAPFGEESLWPGSGLMSCWNGAFASFLLPKYYNPETQAEPKRNILCVSENDFSSKILQVGCLANPPEMLTARSVPDDAES